LKADYHTWLQEMIPGQELIPGALKPGAFYADFTGGECAEPYLALHLVVPAVTIVVVAQHRVPGQRAIEINDSNDVEWTKKSHSGRGYTLIRRSGNEPSPCVYMRIHPDGQSRSVVSSRRCSR